jgi:UDP:flavonoid glycosyltransferase YjiC (YdhE family)
VFPFDLISHYVRCLQLAEAMQDAREILFAHSKKYAWLVEKAGFGTFACEGFEAEEVMACARRFDFSWLNEGDLERVFLSQVECIRQFQPAAVIGDTAPTLKMAAAQTQTPYLALMNGYMTKYYALVRPIARAHPAARFQEKVPEKIFEKMVEFGERTAFRQVHKPFRMLRKKSGLPAMQTYLDELEGDENLICDLPEFFPQKNLPRNYHVIGPLFHAGEQPEPEILDFLDNGRQSLLISAGSSGTFENFAFLNERDFRKFNIVAAGEANGVLHGDHVLCKRFINNAAILDKIDLVICHGGNGSIYQALAFGAPVLCATSIFEQEWNVQRVVDLQLGASLDGITDRTQLANLIDHWIRQKHTPRFKEMRVKISIDESRARFKQFWATLPIS